MFWWSEMVGRFLKKRCSKCGGNVYLESYYYGWYEHCLQCGYNYYSDVVEEELDSVCQDGAERIGVA